MSLQDIDRGYQRIIADLEAMALTPVGIYVGIPEETGAVRPEEDGPTVAEYATANEFGTDRIPERSFLRSTVDEQQGKIADLLQRSVVDVVDGKYPLMTGFNRMGLWLAGKVQAKIRDLKDPPNAPYTIEQKGSSNPLIDTGRMRQSIRHVVRP